MKKQTRSLLEELDNIVIFKDRNHIIASRGHHIIESAINLINMIRENCDSEIAKDLERRLLNSIRTQDSRKFNRGVKKL